jgi:hypothetical protein
MAGEQKGKPQEQGRPGRTGKLRVPAGEAVVEGFDWPATT